jgi:hypothetical protein
LSQRRPQLVEFGASAHQWPIHPRPPVAERNACRRPGSVTCTDGVMPGFEYPVLVTCDTGAGGLAR